jgi:formate dehydrogenase maturation protein FdhE
MTRRIVNAVAWMVRFAIRLFPWLSASYRVRINPRQRCPWCGAVDKHGIETDMENGIVKLHCVVCSGIWGFNALTQKEKLVREPTEDEEAKRDGKA